MPSLPRDSDTRRTDSRACAIVHYQIDSDQWLYRQLTGQDVGVDCQLELSDRNRWIAKKVEVQIKGTRHIERYLRTGGCSLSYPIDVKTIGYALNSPIPFFLFLVDVVDERVYYHELHEHFIHHPELLAKLEDGQKTISIRLPVDSVLTAHDSAIARLADHSYAWVDGEGPKRLQ